jgi:hypothetical protein
MGGFKESLDELEIYRLQSNSGQSTQVSSSRRTESYRSPFERRYLAKLQREKEESNSASNLVVEKISKLNTSSQNSSTSETSLNKLVSHFNNKLQKKRK